MWMKDIRGHTSSVSSARWWYVWGLSPRTGKFGIRTKKTYRLTTPKWTSLWNATVRVNGALKWHKNIERVRGDGGSFFNDETGSGDVF